MRRPRPADVFTAALALCLVAERLPARAEDARAENLPIIVTYEIRKQRIARRSAARDPRKFWIRQVFNRIEDKIAQLPKDLKAAVTVKLSFSVGHDGRLLSKSVSTSSGDADADKAATAMLERAAPFPSMPDAMSDTEMTFSLPVRFR